LKKKEMELLVKKASLALFLKEQYAYHERQVIEEVSKNPQLQQALEEVREVSIKLDALNEEIDSHPNVKQLREIISSASRRQPTLDEEISDLPSGIREAFVFAKAVSHAFSDLMKIK